MNRKKEKNNRICNLNNIKFTKKHSTWVDHRDHILEITDKDGNLAYAGDIKSAAEALGVTSAAISNCANGRLKTVAGCKMRWLDLVTLKPIH